ncbi:MAG: phosphotyrosine protein phosphatase [Alphaproteobacteria bacterium]|nr:phosphotyrosine protein phosphatase [Alphaproteobacteria bacterium]
MKKRILFVCTGNICRSPTAEGVFTLFAQKLGLADDFEFESAGTHRYHIGSPPDPRAISIASERGYDISSLRAKQVKPEDFENYDYIFALDRGHLASLRRLRINNSKAQLAMLSSLVADAEYPYDIPDPYYKGGQEFAYVLELIELAAENFFKSIRE